MKVTLVEPQKKNLRRYNIYLDGSFAFGADEDLVVDQRLVPGKEIKPEDIEKLLYEVEVGKLMERMYGLFNIRMRSEREIRDYLKNLSFKRKLKGDEPVSDLTVESLIERLKQKNLINDSFFAKSWMEARRKSKKKGVIAIKAELFQKGISREIVEEIFREEPEISEEDLASLALEKRIKRWEGLPSQEFQKKALDFLMRRGFEFSVAKKAIEKQLKIG